MSSISPENMTQRGLALLGTLLLLFASVSCDFGGTIRSSERSDGAASRSEVPEVDLVQETSPPPGSTRVTEVVDIALPSVVNVRVKNVGSNPLTGELEQRSGEGSGVVIDRQGIIVTNNHVIEGAVDVNVVFNDGRDPLEGRVIGAIPENDLAVIQVEANDLKAIDIGRSDDLDLGQGVLAIGFPLGLGGPTVTQGIVSGLERTIQVNDEGGTKALEGLLQTDAAINPGNSGGALVDMAGRLVGINTAAAQASSAENIGFAIAIDEAIPIVEEMLEDPPEEVAWMGVSLGSIDSSSAAAQFGLDPDRRGALVVGVVPSSPADDAGLRGGDLIVEIADREIASADDVSDVLRNLDPGETVEVRFIRSPEDRVESVEVELAARPAVFEPSG